MGKQSKTAVPSTSGRAKTTEPDRSTMKRTNNSNTSNKRARLKLNKPNSGSTIDPVACALYRSRQKFPIRYTYHIAPNQSKSHDCLQARDSDACVIALRLTKHKPADADFRKLEYVGHTVWYASLWDGSCMSHRDMHDPFLEMFTDDSKASTRDSMIRFFQDNARNFGFSHCEVRVYVGTSDNYVPLFGGPLPAST